MDTTVPKPPVKGGKTRAPAGAGVSANPLPKVKPTGKKPAPIAKPAGPSPMPAALAAPAPTAAPAPAVMAKPAPAPEPAPALPDPVAPPAPVVATPQPAVDPIDTPVAVPLAEAPAPIVPTAAKETIMETIENVTAKTQTAFNDATSHAKGAVEKSQKMFEEANEFGKGNIEALVESSKIAVRGIEALSQDAAAFAKKSFEDATTAAKTLASVKSPTEFMKLQSDYIRSAFDAMVQHSSHTTETMLKLAGEVAQPLSNRASLAAEKMKVAA